MISVIRHTMLRVADLEKSLRFYVGILGMKLLRREDYPSERFTLAFVGYGPETTTHALELTHNWDVSAYSQGTAFGHIALGVMDIYGLSATLEAKGVKITRPPGPMTALSPQRVAPEIIAFIEDPDGYKIELIQT
jgi:lactoylglutathione lyase